MSSFDQTQTPVCVSAPAMVFPEHEVTLDEILENIAERHRGHRRLPVFLRVASATKVARRRFTQPLSRVASVEPIQARNGWAFEDLCRLGEAAARQVLDRNGLGAADIDCLVTSHSTGVAVPGLDVHLIRTLGLRPTVRRIGLTQLGCAGGIVGLIRAAEQVRGYGGRVLVVCSEALGSIYRHADTDLDAMIYKALFGDGAAAVIVSAEPFGPGLRLGQSWEYTLPDSAERYQMAIDENGFQLDSTPNAPDAADEVMPELLDWYRSAPRSALDFAVSHSGGPRILEHIDKALDDGGVLTRHSWDSLISYGNLGGVAVLDALDRHHREPPHDGAQGVVMGFGPGFTAAAARATWSSAPN